MNTEHQALTDVPIWLLVLLSMAGMEMPGRTDLFAERMISAQGFKVGLDGEYLVDSVEQVFTQSGWSTTVECNGGKKGKTKAKGKKKKQTKPLKVVELSPSALRDRLAAADLRLSVLLDATTQGGDCGVSATTSGTGVVHGAIRANLDPRHA